MNPDIDINSLSDAEWTRLLAMAQAWLALVLDDGRVVSADRCRELRDELDATANELGEAQIYVLRMATPKLRFCQGDMLDEALALEDLGFTEVSGAYYCSTALGRAVIEIRKPNRAGRT